MTEPNESRLFGRRRRANAEPVHRRDKRYTVKASPAEQAQLEARAAARGVTVPRLMFEAAMNLHVETSTDRKAAIAELFALRRLMANVANNANQLARFANAEGQFPVEAAAAIEEYRALVPRIREAVERLAG